jgi:4'-phosphopantetheinyl transferase EntD
MPLLYQQNINEHVKWALWQMDEPESFFILDGYDANHIGHAHKRKQHLAGRYVMKFLMPDLNVNDIIVPPNRKPYFSKHTGVDFSVSHSNQMVGVLIGQQHHVGMDIEFPGQKVISVKDKFMTKEEFIVFHGDSVSDQEKATICWTIKESAYKLIGKMGVDFKRDLQIKEVMTTGEGWTSRLKYSGLPDDLLTANGFCIEGAHVCLMMKKN